MAREKEKKPEGICCKHLILCEGKDDLGFLRCWLNSPELADRKEFSTDFQVLIFNGTGNLPLFLDALKARSGYNMVESILVIRDADENADSAKAQVISAFHQAKMPIPKTPHEWQTDGHIKTGFLLFPSCDRDTENGALEDLCLQILNDEKANQVIAYSDGLINSLEKTELRTFPHKNKARLHTYFSVTDDFISLKVGEAAKAGAFDWSHSKLLPLRSFLEELLEHPNKEETTHA